MELDFYGIKTGPPTKSIAEAFGSKEDPTVLSGGQGTTYASGEIILKPAGDAGWENWEAEVFSGLPDSDQVRFARPIKSTEGNWIYGSYVAWSFLKGEHIKGQYNKKLTASRAFHNLLKDVKRPILFDTPKSSWAVADKMAWQEQELDYDKEFMDLIDQIRPKLRSLNLPSQLIHGDLSGNFLLDKDLLPAIIDFSPAWAPSGFAEGIMLADVIAWEGADSASLEAFKEIPNIDQYVWRGILRRIIEQAEHIKWFDKDKNQAVREAKEFQKAIDYMNVNFN